jgi:hypothetical protein
MWFSSFVTSTKQLAHHTPSWCKLISKSCKDLPASGHARRLGRAELLWIYDRERGDGEGRNGEVGMRMGV